MPLRAIKLFYTVAFYPVSRARLHRPGHRSSSSLAPREGRKGSISRNAISTPVANLNSLSLAALIATPRGTRKLVLHRVKCLLSPSFPLSLFVLFSRNSIGYGDSLESVLYFAFIVVRTEASPFSRVYRVGYASLRRIDGCQDALFGPSLQPPVPFDEFSSATMLPKPVVLSINEFYELIAAVYQRDVISPLNRRTVVSQVFVSFLLLFSYR